MTWLVYVSARVVLENLHNLSLPSLLKKFLRLGGHILKFINIPI